MTVWPWLRIEEKKGRCSAVGEPENAMKLRKALKSYSDERERQSPQSE